MSTFRSEYDHWVGVVRELVSRRNKRMSSLRVMVQGQLDRDMRAGMYRSATKQDLARLLDAKYMEYVDNDIEVRGLSGEIRDAQQAAIMYGLGALMEQPARDVFVPAQRG